MDCWFNLNEQFVLLELKEDICLFDKNCFFFLYRWISKNENNPHF